jgi:hypothetical protein
MPNTESHDQRKREIAVTNWKKCRLASVDSRARTIFVRAHRHTVHAALSDFVYPFVWVRMSAAGRGYQKGKTGWRRQASFQKEKSSRGKESAFANEIRVFFFVSSCGRALRPRRKQRSLGL